jgi:hypothetical protein
MQAEKRASEMESTRVQVTKASTPQIVHDKRRPVLNAGSFVDVAPTLTPGHCSYGGHAWVVDSCLDAKGRTLVSVRYALEGNIEKHVELTRIIYSPGNSTTCLCSSSKTNHHRHHTTTSRGTHDGKKGICRQADRDEFGRLRYDGEVLREKGDIHLVDSTVTGSDACTCRSPKCLLLPLFLDTVFPKVEALVGVVGRYAGYVPIIQGDNAHDASFFDAAVDTKRTSS